MTKKILFAIIACAACVTLAAGQVFSAGEKVPVPEQKGTPEYPAARHPPDDPSGWTG